MRGGTDDVSLDDGVLYGATILPGGVPDVGELALVVVCTSGRPFRLLSPYW